MNAASLQNQLFIIAEPNRFKIVELLKEGPRTVGDLVKALGISQPLVSRHLKVLSEAGMVGVQKRAQQRIYTLEPQPFRDLVSWFNSFESVWEDRLDAMETLLMEETEERNKDVRNP